MIRKKSHDFVWLVFVNFMTSWLAGWLVGRQAGWLALVLYWSCTGLVLVLYWSCTGLVLVLYWSCTGLVLVLYWSCTGLAGPAGLVLVLYCLVLVLEHLHEMSTTHETATNKQKTHQISRTGSLAGSGWLWVVLGGCGPDQASSQKPKALRPSKA